MLAHNLFILHCAEKLDAGLRAIRSLFALHIERWVPQANGAECWLLATIVFTPMPPLPTRQTGGRFRNFDLLEIHISYILGHLPLISPKYKVNSVFLTDAANRIFGI